MIYGERVRQVREMHRLTQASLADKLPTLTQYRLSRVEGGRLDPDEETVAMLASVLGVTVDFFERPPFPDVQALSPQLRSRSSRLTQGSKNSALQWARLIMEEYERLQAAAKAIPVRLRPLYSLSPSDAAHEVRDWLGFSANEPLPYLVLAVERLGVAVLGVPFPADAMDAFCAWRDGSPVVGLLSGAPGDGLRFSLAHEIGHLVLHDSTATTGKDAESQADQFAAELLTPLLAMRKAMPSRITLSTLTMLKSQWGVSIKALIRRARELGHVDQDRAISFYKQISSRGWNQVEPGHVPREKPRALRKLAEISYGSGPNIEKMAADAGWSEELAQQVLAEHATPEELPSAGPVKRDSLPANVVPLRRRA